MHFNFLNQVFHFVLFLLKSRVPFAIVSEFLHLRHDGGPEDFVDRVELHIFFYYHFL